MSDPWDSGVFMSAINSSLYTKTYTPNHTTTVNRYLGSGLNELGQQLQTLSGPTLTNSIKGGVIATNDDEKYWVNDINEVFGETYKYDWFDIAFNKIDIIPTGKLVFSHRYYVEADFLYQPEYHALELWATKHHNSSLSGDILIGQYDTIPYAGWLLNQWTNEFLEFTVNEGGRNTWEPLIPNLYISVSGMLRYGVNNPWTWKISGMELTASGSLYVASTSGTNNSFDMYTGGFSSASGSFDLITFSEAPSGNLPLFICCKAPSGNLPFFMSGSSQSSGNFNMFLSGSLVSSGQFDASILGHDDTTKQLLMMVKAPTLGSGINGPEMMIVGPSQLPFSGIIPMVVYQNTSPNLSLDMFIQNSAVAANSGFNMFIQAPSGTYGAVPLSGVLPMYIARDSEGIDAGINMYIGGPTSESSGFNMFIDGTQSNTANFNISISGGGPINNSLNTYIHGF